MTLPESKPNLIGHSQDSPTSRVAAALNPQKGVSVTSLNGATLPLVSFDYDQQVSAMRARFFVTPEEQAQAKLLDLRNN